jgi:glycosyltransferase involved in cell wall biosynthesis
VVVVVDDGSGDETADRAQAAGATVVSHRHNSGYGAALKTIFREAAAREADRLVILDADGQHDPADVGQLAAAIDDADADIVVGSRFTAGGDTDAPVYRRVGLAVINWLTNVSLGRHGRARIADTQSGFRAYSQRAVASLAAADDVDDRMGASLDILYHAARRDWVVTEVGTSVTYEVENANTSNPVRHGFQLLARIVRRTVRDRLLSGSTATAPVTTTLRSEGPSSGSQSRSRSRR